MEGKAATPESDTMPQPKSVPPITSVEGTAAPPEPQPAQEPMLQSIPSIGRLRCHQPFSIHHLAGELWFKQFFPTQTYSRRRAALSETGGPSVAFCHVFLPNLMVQTYHWCVAPLRTASRCLLVCLQCSVLRTHISQNSQYTTLCPPRVA